MTIVEIAYIVNHSTNYTIAALASWTEFWLEYLLFGRFKIQVWLFVIGTIIVLLGQVSHFECKFQCNYTVGIEDHSDVAVRGTLFSPNHG